MLVQVSPGDGSVSVRVAAQPAEDGLAPYGPDVSKGASISLDALEKTVDGVLAVAQRLESSFIRAFPGRSADVEFGLSVTGELDAKIVAVGTEADFRISLKIGVQDDAE